MRKTKKDVKAARGKGRDAAAGQKRPGVSASPSKPKKGKSPRDPGQVRNVRFDKQPVFLFV